MFLIILKLIILVKYNLSIIILQGKLMQFQTTELCLTFQFPILGSPNFLISFHFTGHSSNLK